MKQAGLRGAGVHIHLLDAAVFGTCKEKSGLPGLLCLLTTSHPTPHYLPEPRSTGRNHSPQSMKRRGSARAVAPRARSKASDDSTMTAASAGRAAASPRRHVSSAAPPAGQLGGAPPWDETARRRGTGGDMVAVGVCSERWMGLAHGTLPHPVLRPRAGQQLEHRRDSSGTAAGWIGGNHDCSGTTALGQTPSAIALLLEIPAPGLYCRIQR